jgi:ribonuclease HI
VKNPTLQRLHADARAIASDFARVSYEHVPRERNVEADRLANQGVDAWLADGGITRTPPPPMSEEAEEPR